MEKTFRTVVKGQTDSYSTQSEQKSKIERLQFKAEIDKILKPIIEFESEIPEIVNKIISETKLVNDLLDSVKSNIKQTASESGTSICIHIYPGGRVRFINCNTTISKVISTNFFSSQPYTQDVLIDYNFDKKKLIWQKLVTALMNEIEQFLLDCNFTYKRDDTLSDILINLR